VLRSVTIVGLVLAASAFAPASARGDGLPVTGVDAGWSGVTTPDSPARYVTVPAGRDTVLARVRRDGGQVLQSRVLRGSLTIPAVALDGTGSGLAADGRTLVLIRPRPGYPRARTTLAVVDARMLTVRRVLRLNGDFSFDALSPDGGTLYLIQYTSRRDPTRYAVRAMDLRSGRLLPAPIVDPREPDERMRGYPLTRATSEDGRWEYTLYDGAGSHPFVHALDTVDQTAVCIDLDGLTGRKDLQALRLSLDSGQEQLSVVKGADPVALIDIRTFAVRMADATTAEDESSSSMAPWLAGGLVTLLLGAAVARILRRRRPATSH
jgi:hypothetical protein